MNEDTRDPSVTSTEIDTAFDIYVNDWSAVYWPKNRCRLPFWGTSELTGLAS